MDEDDELRMRGYIFGTKADADHFDVWMRDMREYARRMREPMWREERHEHERRVLGADGGETARVAGGDGGAGRYAGGGEAGPGGSAVDGAAGAVEGRGGSVMVVQGWVRDEDGWVSVLRRKPSEAERAAGVQGEVLTRVSRKGEQDRQAGADEQEQERKAETERQ